MTTCNITDRKHQTWDTGGTQYPTCYRHTAPSEMIVRCVWEVVSAHPRWTLDELRYAAGLSRSVVYRALNALEQRGAISRDAFKSRTIVIKAINHAGHAYTIEWL